MSKRKQKRQKPEYALSVDDNGLGVILEDGGVSYEIDNLSFTAEQGRVVYDLLTQGYPSDWDSLEPLFDAECKRRGIDILCLSDTAEEG